MKKILYVLLVLALCVGLAACSSGAEKDARIAELESQVEKLQSQLQAKADSETVNESSSDSPAIISDKTVDDSNQRVKEPQIINLDEKITFDWAEFSLDSVEWVNEIYPSNMSGYYTYYEKTDGEIYIVVRGTWKNTSGDAYDIGDIASKFILNDKYNYKGQSTKERDNGTGFEPFSLNPLKSIKFVIFASVPDEAKEQF